MAENYESLETQLGAPQLPRIWLKAFWGFDPENDGYLGFTRSSDRKRFLEQALPTDLVLIYGAGTKETEKTKRQQALGILQVSLEEIRDFDKLSPNALALKREQGWEDRWTHAVPVRKAWKVARKIGVKNVAPITYNADQARVIASRGELMLADEVQLVLRLPVVPVNVFGEPHHPEFDVSPANQIQLLDLFSPSRGVLPTFGKREFTTQDGDHFLYILKLECDPTTLLDKGQFDLYKKCIVKIGLSNEPNRRCDDHNGALPPASHLKYRLLVKSKAYPTGEAAKKAEDILKDALKLKCKSLGKEFFLGSEQELLSVFASTPGAGFLIQGGTQVS